MPVLGAEAQVAVAARANVFAVRQIDLHPCLMQHFSNAMANIDLPAPERPVNQTL